MAVRRLIRARRREEGFTLLEVVIAMSVLAFGMLALAAMQIHSLRNGRTGRHFTQAMVVAQDQMEAFQRTSFTGMADTAGAWTAPQTVTAQTNNSTYATEQSYSVDWRITDEVAGWTKLVDVRVSWNEPDFPTRQIVLSSRRYNW